ncbi:MAG: hypothetical protein NT175_03420 [Bacteroidetes bacterium]|nr:hypothetical protein [Bacteroidota bacterium]
MIKKDVVHDNIPPVWGGVWTIKKLDAFSKYVWSYLAIMKKHPYWKTMYVFRIIPG